MGSVFSCWKVTSTTSFVNCLLVSFPINLLCLIDDLCICVCCSVTHSCLTLCNFMDCSIAGFPVHHQVLELAQIHVHRVGDAIQPSHPSAGPFSFCLQSFPESGSFPMSRLFASAPKYWAFTFSISPSNEYSGLISFRVDWFESPCCPRDSEESSPTP